MKYWTVDMENYTTHVKVSVFEIQANDANEAKYIALDNMRDHEAWTVTSVDLTDDTGTQH